jgi:hypothetical protein
MSLLRQKVPPPLQLLIAALKMVNGRAHDRFQDSKALTRSLRFSGCSVASAIIG